MSILEVIAMGSEQGRLVQGKGEVMNSFAERGFLQDIPRLWTAEGNSSQCGDISLSIINEKEGKTPGGK